MVDYSVDYGQTLSPFPALLRSLMPCFAYLDVPNVIRSRRADGSCFFNGDEVDALLSGALFH